MLAVMVTAPLLWLGAQVMPGIAADDAPRMSTQQLKDLLGKRSVKVIDVRSAPDWDQSGHKIKGAIRHTADQVDIRAKTYPKDLTLIFYCT